jgi:hypothetical protein
VVKRKIDEQVLAKRISEICHLYLDLLRLRVAVKRAELRQRRESRPIGPRGNKGNE